MSVLFCLFAPTLCMDFFYYYEGNLSLSLDEYIYTHLIMFEREVAVAVVEPVETGAGESMRRNVNGSVAVWPCPAR